MNRLIAALASLSLLALAPGCKKSNSNEPFDPFLGDVTVNATWTIDGAAPTSELCADANIVNVELRFLEVGTGEVGTDASLRAPCTTAAGFSTGAMVTAGAYDVQFVGLDASGAVSVRTTPARVMFEESSTYDIVGAFEPPRDVPEALEVVVLFEETRGLVDFTDCATAGVSSFDFTLRGSGGAVVDSAVNLTCADLPLDFGDDLIAPDTYRIEIDARDTGAGRWETTCTGLEVNEGEDSMWTCDVIQP